MSRPIKITKDILEDAKKEFEDQLSKMDVKMFDGKVSFTKVYKWKGDHKASIIFSLPAYFKMFKLIQEFSDEVAWHGVVQRDKDDDSVFYITDILVYPQEVTGATVNTDQIKYQNWLMELEDDTFNGLKMQGHSHVNMEPSPSSVDTAHQEAILAQLKDSMFYIFMIWNKSLKHNIKIFDLQNNTLYEGDDIDVRIDSEGENIEEFITKAKENVSKKSYSYIQTKAPTPVYVKNHKKEEKKKNIDGVGNGWNGRGMSSLDTYYDEAYGYNGYGIGDYYKK